MEARKKKQPQPTTSDTRDRLCHENKVTELKKENDLLREQLEDSQFKQHMAETRLAAAEKKITELKTQLEDVCCDLVNSGKISASHYLRVDAEMQTVVQKNANFSANVSVVQSTKCPQTKMTDLSDLILQLQKAHEDVHKCTDKLSSNDDSENTDDAEQEQQEKVQVLKKKIMDLSVKLQEEQGTLLKKAIKLVPCNTEGEGTVQKVQSEQADQVEKVNLHIQKIQTELLQQALSLKTTVKEKKTPSKYQWIRTHRDQEQQTDELDETEERQLQEAQQSLSDETAKNNEEKEGLLFQIQQLKEKVSAEEALRMKNETTTQDLKAELRKKSFAVEEAQLKVGQLMKDVLKSKEEAQKESEKTKASYMVQVEHQKKVNDEATAAQKKAEEQLQVHQKLWQEERASFQKAIDRLQQTLKEKQQEWSEIERDTGSRMDDLESKMKEMLDKKSKKKKGWLSRHFKIFGAK